MIRVTSFEAKISFTTRSFPSCLLRRVTPSPPWMCLIHSTKNLVSRKSNGEDRPWWPKKCFLSMYQDFLIRTMNHPPFRSFICLRAFWWKATRFDYFTHIFIFLLLEGTSMWGENYHVYFSSHLFTSRFRGQK